MIPKELSIPVITEVRRNIDGIEMIRCSYYSIQSDTPRVNWDINISIKNSQMLILNLEAILVGPIDSDQEFNSIKDIDSMYEFVEEHEGLFVDINDIWIPADWFNQEEVKQGLVFRLPQANFILCWKFRNDNISAEEFLAASEELHLPYITQSEKETSLFQDWTMSQIQISKDIYQSNRSEYLTKFAE